LKTDKTAIADLPDQTEVKAYCQLRCKQAALHERPVKDLTAQLENAEGISAARCAGGTHSPTGERPPAD
jgi:hypothetical protein